MIAEPVRAAVIVTQQELMIEDGRKSGAAVAGHCVLCWFPQGTAAI